MRGNFGAITVGKKGVWKKPLSDDDFPYFVREISALRFLQPHIDGIIRINDVDGTRINMDRYQGDLSDLIGNIPPQDVYQITYHVLVVLHNLQKLNLSHRDIKPHNILYKPGPKSMDLALCDFGLARPNNHTKKQCTPSVQTQTYRSPELIFGASDVNYNVLDIWSLGITILHLFGLYSLLPKDTEHATYKTLYEDLKLPSEDIMDAGFLEVVKDMLTLDHHKRPEASQLLQHPFFEGFSGPKIITDKEAQSILSKLHAANRPTDPYNAERTAFIESISHLPISDEIRHSSTMLYNKLIAVNMCITDEVMLNIVALSSFLYGEFHFPYDSSVCLDLLKAIDYNIVVPLIEPCLG